MKKEGRLHIGVLVSNIDDPCQYKILQGINEFAVEHDINLTIYVGTCHMPERGNVSHLEVCFELMKKTKSLDGVILFAGYVGHVYDNDTIERVVQEFSEHIPTVSVSFPSKGTPTVLAENISGTYDAVNHLICEHGKKQIAFICGPEGNREGNERFLGYKKALEDNGIKYDERYSLPGDFVRRTGAKAVRELIDERKLPFDAIAVSNDESAIGAIEELGKRGILVPRNVAVVSFDDNRESATYIPSISTARQDFYEIGRRGTSMLQRKINGEQVEDLEYINPTFMIRQSCGCLGREIESVTNRQIDTNSDDSNMESFVMREFKSIFKGEVEEITVEKLAGNLVAQIKKDPFCQDDFCRLVDGYLVEYNYFSGDLNKCFDALSVLTFGVQKFENEVVSVRPIINAVVFAATLINNVKVKENVINEYKQAETRLRLRRTTSSLAQTNDLNSIAEELYRSLPSLRMDSALVGVYKNMKIVKEGSEIGVIEEMVGFCGDERIHLKQTYERQILFHDYSTMKGFDFESQRMSVFIFPLFFEKQDLGLLLLPYDKNVTSDVYESLRVTISSSVKGSELLTQIRELSITDELTGILNRRGFLEFAYSRLRQLSRDELKMAVVLYMDLDGLKQINDTYGHKEGDTAIKIFAKILKETLREEDIAGRVGGDEFVVLATVKANEESALLESRLRKNIDEYNKLRIHQYNISASIGYSVLEVNTKKEFDVALRGADNVLYDEKMKKKALKGLVSV
ncbi:MAG: GGDEF domain-containing protein [Oscillospiraceae bacterium]|nr:GGDEF domain-containing protein [Oscillospiraceae bacterium]